MISVRPKVEVRAIGIFNEIEFIRCKGDRSDFALPDHYDDWLDEREGLQVGLSSAGVRAVLITVYLDHFLDWCRDESALVDERALDRFAATQIQRYDRLLDAAPLCQRSLYQSDVWRVGQPH